jgi:tyrosine aminotransferase
MVDTLDLFGHGSTQLTRLESLFLTFCSIYGTLKHVEDGAKQLAQVILGASHLAQSIVPALLDPNNFAVRTWKNNILQTLEVQAQFLYERLCEAPGLEVCKAQGAMYIMLRIRIEEFDVANDLEFTQQLLSEENVFVLPGTCFDYPNAFRVVFCADIPTLQQASDRIIRFCQRHWRRY